MKHGQGSALNGTAVIGAILVLACNFFFVTPASARLLPRVDLTDGPSMGFQSTNAAAAYKSGPIAIALDLLVSPSSRGSYYDPSLGATVAFSHNDHMIVGLEGTIETITTSIPSNIHQLVGDIGLSFSLFHVFPISSETSVRLYVDPTISIGLAGNGGVILGHSSGYEAGLVLNNNFDLMLTNAPLLNTTVVGVRGHL